MPRGEATDEAEGASPTHPPSRSLAVSEKRAQRFRGSRQSSFSKTAKEGKGEAEGEKEEGATAKKKAGAQRGPAAMRFSLCSGS